MSLNYYIKNKIHLLELQEFNLNLNLIENVEDHIKDKLKINVY